jgi:hypothetical protein
VQPESLCDSLVRNPSLTGEGATSSLSGCVTLSRSSDIDHRAPLRKVLITRAEQLFVDGVYLETRDTLWGRQSLWELGPCTHEGAVRRRE